MPYLTQTGGSRALNNLLRQLQVSVCAWQIQAIRWPTN